MRDLLHCRLCPRQCAANRLAGERGYCGAGAMPKVFRWGPHNGEEPPISGDRGSGAVFFSHCTLGCLYCQNHPWSAGGQGEEMTVDGLKDIFKALAAKGCHNWNLVTPEPWLPQIREAGLRARAEGSSLPFVYNTSGYVRPEMAREYRDLMDIVLADLRYATAGCASEASRAPDYPEVAREYVKWAWDSIGPLEVDGDGIATRGVIVRVLVLPGRASEAVASLRWLAENCGTGVHVSMMSQYTPVHRALQTPGWDRKITFEELESVTDEAARLGLETGWTQEFETATADDDLLGRNMAPGEGSVGRARQASDEGSTPR